MATSDWRSLRTGKKQERHGKRYLPEYQVWLQMKGRCQNPRNKRFVYYGARGISVCPRWSESFEAFYSDMGPRPEGTSLERKDNDQGYGPANCVWLPAKEQQRNRRNVLRVTLDGVEKSLPEWAEVLEKPLRTLYCRIKCYGWDPVRALTEPVHPTKRRRSAASS